MRSMTALDVQTKCLSPPPPPFHHYHLQNFLVFIQFRSFLVEINSNFKHKLKAIGKDIFKENSSYLSFIHAISKQSLNRIWVYVEENRKCLLIS